MNQIMKSKPLRKTEVVIEQDIQLINQYSLKTLTPEDVFAFSVILCDNDVDRDYEQFSDSCLAGLVPLFLGKTGIFNHSWNAKDQIARIYHVALENAEGKNSQGVQKKQLKALAYIPRGEGTNEIISKIEGGILKEISVGVAVASRSCSVCGEPVSWGGCKNGHIVGRSYDTETCIGILDDPQDAYEFSFVAVPAQRGAGVTKEFDPQNLEARWKSIVQDMAGLDTGQQKTMAEKICSDTKLLLMQEQERTKRQEILVNNKKYLKKEVL